MEKNSGTIGGMYENEDSEVAEILALQETETATEKETTAKPKNERREQLKRFNAAVFNHYNDFYLNAKLEKKNYLLTAQADKKLTEITDKLTLFNKSQVLDYILTHVNDLVKI